jgi:hypothetical protein
MGLPEPSADPKRTPDTRDAGAVAGETGGIVPTVEETKDNKLDHRHLGDWGSRYAAAAWRQIGVEFAYLVIVLFGAITLLAWIGYHVAPPSPPDERPIPLFWLDLVYPRDRTFLLWMAVGLSGIAGGTSFSLKWLYHSVAKALWNRDRILWRLIVPFLSGTLAVFVSMLVASGILSLIDQRFFHNFYGAVGIGWLLGYFSDNVLASLQKLAHKWFGTVDEPKGDSPDTRPSTPATPVR